MIDAAAHGLHTLPAIQLTDAANTSSATLTSGRGRVHVLEKNVPGNVVQIGATLSADGAFNLCSSKPSLPACADRLPASKAALPVPRAMPPAHKGCSPKRAVPKYYPCLPGRHGRCFYGYSGYCKSTTGPGWNVNLTYQVGANGCSLSNSLHHRLQHV